MPRKTSQSRKSAGASVSQELTPVISRLFDNMQADAWRTTSPQSDALSELATLHDKKLTELKKVADEARSRAQAVKEIRLEVDNTREYFLSQLRALRQELDQTTSHSDLIQISTRFFQLSDSTINTLTDHQSSTADNEKFFNHGLDRKAYQVSKSACAAAELLSHGPALVEQVRLELGAMLATPSDRLSGTMRVGIIFGVSILALSGLAMFWPLLSDSVIETVTTTPFKSLGLILLATLASAICVFMLLQGERSWAYFYFSILPPAWILKNHVGVGALLLTLVTGVLTIRFLISRADAIAQRRSNKHLDSIERIKHEFVSNMLLLASDEKSGSFKVTSDCEKALHRCAEKKEEALLDLFYVEKSAADAIFFIEGVKKRYKALFYKTFLVSQSTNQYAANAE